MRRWRGFASFCINRKVRSRYSRLALQRSEMLTLRCAAQALLGTCMNQGHHQDWVRKPMWLLVAHADKNIIR